MYRFRKIDSLLDKYHELENQEIYFAAPDELNDPMEGYRDIFWKGDKIVWRNFIVNYIKSLENIFNLLLLSNNKKVIGEGDIIVSNKLIGLSSPKKRDLIQQLIDNVFELKFIDELPDSLSERINAIRRSELLSYLQIIHPFIVNCISELYFNNGLSNKKQSYRNIDDLKLVIEKSGNLIGLTNKFETDNNINDIEAFYTVTNIYSQSLTLLNQYKISNTGTNPNAIFLTSEFPEKFLSKLESAIYPNWYSASFLYDCSNSSIWGHYGDNHRGICLKFKTIENDQKLIINLETEYGYSSGPIIGMRPHVFSKIQYHNKHIEIDFFRSMGRMTKHELNSLWYLDSNGNSSICSEHFIKNEEKWRERYWDNFSNSLLIKLSEWSYEQEYRLIIHGDFIDYSNKTSRLLKYDFNDLEGIIFGIKTQNSDKIKILKIIEAKCKVHNRKQFDFHQAYYSKESGKIETFKLNLLD